MTTQSPSPPRREGVSVEWRFTTVNELKLRSLIAAIVRAGREDAPSRKYEREA